MSFAGASASADGESTQPEGSGSFGFKPDYSVEAPPPDYMAVRRTIMDDPSLRLDFHWNEAKAQQDAKQIDTKRYTDAAVLPLIQADMERNQQHIDYMRQQVMDFQQKLQTPYPIRHMASFDTADTIGLLASSLLGGNIGHQAGQVEASNQASSDNTYQNEVNQFGLDQHRGEAIVAAAQAELNRSLGYQQQLSGEQISQTSHEADVNNSNIEKARQRFQTASNPGEVDAAAQELAGYGVTLPQSAIDDARKAANIRSDQEKRLTASSAYTQLDNEIRMYGGSADDAQRQAWQDQADKIAAMTGIPHAAIPGGRTWQAEQDKALNEFKAKNLAANQAHWQAELKTKNKQLANQVAEWQTEREFRAKQASLSQDSAARIALIKTNDTHIGAMTSKRDLSAAELKSKQARLLDIQGQLAKAPKATHAQREAIKGLYAQQASLQTAIGNLTDDVNKYNQVLGQMQRVAETDAGTGQQQQQAPNGGGGGGGQTRTYQGHQYQQDASGQWRLVQ